MLFLPLGQPGSTQPAHTGSLPWSPQLGNPMSARHSKPSPSSPATTRSLFSSCCQKFASNPLISPQILFSVKVRCRAKACTASMRCCCCCGLWECCSFGIWVLPLSKHPLCPPAGSVLPAVPPTHSLWSKTFKFSQNMDCCCIYVDLGKGLSSWVASNPQNCLVSEEPYKAPLQHGKCFSTVSGVC